MHLTRRGRVVVAVLVGLVAVAGAGAVASLSGQLPSAQEPAEAAPTAAPTPTPPVRAPPTWQAPSLHDPPRVPTLTDAPATATHEVARSLFERAPVLVVAPLPGEQPGRPRDLLARWLAVSLQAPLVHASPELPALVEDLDVRTVVGVGLSAQDARLVRDIVEDVRSAYIATGALRAIPTFEDIAPDQADPTARQARGDPFGYRGTTGPPVQAWLRDVKGLVGRARSTPAVPEREVGLLLRVGDPAAWASATSAAVAGVRAAAAVGADLRAERDVVGTLAGRPVLLRAGTRGAWADTDPATLAWQLETLRAGHVLPNGAQTLFPGSLLVALYGHPEGGALGALGEQPPEDAVARVRELAASYAPLTDDTVVPTFELIATVASGSAEPTGDYSRRTPIATLRPWVDAAAAAGVYVLLDLQPGRTSFLDQAQEYEELLREPHVGLALDPEWRLGPGQRHLRQIGSVDAAEVNAVGDWLAGLVRRERLPQKLFVVHQFKLSMIRDRPSLRLGHPELAPVIQMDGQGGQASKDGTFRALTTLDPPPFVRWGWKNFYDEDRPGLRSPEGTLAVDPTPVFVSYQ